MAITRHTSGNINDIRDYPFADTATRHDAAGKLLPEFLLNDCHIWWPDVYGDTGFVSTATISPGLVTLTFAAFNSTIGLITPIAAVTIPRAAVAYRSFPISPLQSGVGGWAAIGVIPDYITSIQTWRFETPSDATLLPRLAQAYPAYPVNTVGKDAVTPILHGNVKFLAGNNLDVTEEFRYVNDLFTRCVVFSLDRSQLPDLYEFFAGPCGERPENRNCSQPVIRKINGVEPDKDGLITLQVDNSNGVLDGQLDTVVPGLITVGVALTTIIDYNDICTPVAIFDPLPKDLCDSSLAAVPVLSSATAIIGGSDGSGVATSSNIQAPSVVYSFFDIDTLADFSIYERDNWHMLDWEPTPNQWLLDSSPRVINSTLILPFEVFAGLGRKLVWNAYKTEMLIRNDIVDVSVNFTISFAELLALPKNTDYRVIYIGINTENLINSLAWRGLRARVELSHHSSGCVKASWKLQFRNATAWVDLTVGSSTLHCLRGVLPASSSSGVSQALLYSSSSSTPLLLSSSRAFPQSSSLAVSPSAPIAESSAAPDELTIDLRLLITLVNSFSDSGPSLNSSSSSAAGLNDQYSLTLFYNNVQVDQATFDTDRADADGALHEYRNAKFILFQLDTVAPAEADPRPATDLQLNQIDIAATNLIKQKCSEKDFVGNDTARVGYRVKYTPALGWSNDFGTSRAIQQFNRLPDLNLLVPSLFSVVGSDLVYEKQRLMAAGTSFRYGVLDCEASSAGRFFSVAVRRVSGNPVVGLLLGWQNDSLQQFWFITLDIIQRELIYGMHRRPHQVILASPDSVSSLGVNVSSTWNSEWHRIVVRILPSFNVSVWVDPDDAVACSSSVGLGGCLQKRISVPASPNLFITKSAWDNSSLSADQYADGSPGVFCYGGSAEIAEFTASLVNQDIIVPNKVDWLTR